MIVWFCHLFIFKKLLNVFIIVIVYMFMYIFMYNIYYRPPKSISHTATISLFGLQLNWRKMDESVQTKPNTAVQFTHKSIVCWGWEIWSIRPATLSFVFPSFCLRTNCAVSLILEIPLTHDRTRLILHLIILISPISLVNVCYTKNIMD